MDERAVEVILEETYREEWGRIVATLIGLVGGFGLAEEMAQEAFAAAVEQWPRQGVPVNRRAWLVSVARHKAIDALRRSRRWVGSDEALERLEAASPEVEEVAHPVEDDRLRLIFTCAHPALNREAQVALTLRTLCGLTTEQIAGAFLTPLATMAQRLVRAKQKIRDAGIPYRVPGREELGERLDGVLLVIYLIFNEGYSGAGAGNGLCGEAIRLGRLLSALLPQEPEAQGLLALMLLHNARGAARLSAAGDLILLEEQDRGLWRREEIAEGLALVEAALRRGPGPYGVQAAIAGLHTRALRAEETDWEQIVGLYDVLLRMQPSPVVELNRAVAVAMARGNAAGLKLMDELVGRGEMRNYAPLPAARGALLLRMEKWARAAEAYRQALELVGREPERRFLAGRLREATAQMG